MAKYIHGTSHEEQTRLATLNQLLNHRCLEKIHLQGNERILDVGCGLGIFSRMLAGELAKGQVVGVEKEWDQIERGNVLAKEQELTGPADIRQGSAYALPLRSSEWGSFNLSFIRFLLEHLQAPERALQQVHKALANGGKVILVDDDHANFRITPEMPAFSRLWEAYCKVYEQLGNDPFIGRNLTTLLYQTGFKNLKIDFVLFGAAFDEPDFSLYANNLIGILEGAKDDIKQIYPATHNYEADIQIIREWANLPDATLWYAANWAEGTKGQGE